MLNTNIEWIHIPSGIANIGSSIEEIDSAGEFGRGNYLTVIINYIFLYMYNITGESISLK
ncbi:hypothetical protein [Bacillus pseudomycoides]|uniref:hypothetical protein n=1 Tax=Bacillus pseudomycoides TaxID=64104 RepID=UPI000BFA43CB|nr:hypothetical protein [Bacillus pseudomycoides]PGA45737.1 hypothetical protein COL84_30250 [Bacillus pseudomycoides]